MKKLLLLFIAGFLAAPGFAQKSTSMLNVENAFYGRIQPGDGVHPATRAFDPTALFKSSKGSVVDSSFWYSYVDAQFVSGTSVMRSWLLYDDSTIQINYSSGPGYANINGLGVSFDPTDDTSFNINAVASAFVPPYSLTKTMGYDIDSIEIIGRYWRNNTGSGYIDTLYIDVAVVDTDTCSSTSVLKGTYSRHYYSQTSKRLAKDTLMIWDSLYHFGTGIYDWTHNKLSDSITAPKTKVTKILDDNAANDTVAVTSGFGYNDWKFKLSTKLHANPGQHIMAYIHYKSGHVYPFGTLNTAVNYWAQDAAELNGDGKYPIQYGGEFNTGLAVTNWDRYHMTDGSGNPYYYSLNGHTMMRASYLYFVVATGYAAPYDPYVRFHRASAPVSVNNVASVIDRIAAYPSPANNDLYLLYSLGHTADINVYISNMMGQIVKTQSLKNVQTGSVKFNVADLAPGFYLYTVETEGVQKTGRVTITH